MFEDVKKEHFQDLFRHARVIDFARRVIIRSYTECTPGYETQMEDLLERAFSILSGAKDDPDRFQAAVVSLSRDVFRKPEPDFWFNQVYLQYKRFLKPGYRFEKLKNLLSGTRILDFGCGDGLTSLLLQQHGYQVSLCDVLDYRDEAALTLPFIHMADTRRIPYGDRCFDTAVIMAVLHHVEATDLPSILSELSRTSSRLVIEEDCYDVPAGLPGLADVLAHDEHLSEFISLSLEDQVRYLMFIDYFSNAITQGLSQMDIPFNFRTVAEWETLIERYGFRLTRVLPLGFQARQFNRSCHIWFVFDSHL